MPKMPPARHDADAGHFDGARKRVRCRVGHTRLITIPIPSFTGPSRLQAPISLASHTERAATPDSLVAAVGIHAAATAAGQFSCFAQAATMPLGSRWPFHDAIISFAARRRAAMIACFYDGPRRLLHAPTRAHMHQSRLTPGLPP